MAWLRLVAALIVGVACLQVDQDGKNVIVGLAYLGGWRLVGAGLLTGWSGVSDDNGGLSRQVEEETDQWLGKPASPQLGMPRSIGLANGRLALGLAL